MAFIIIKRKKAFIERDRLYHIYKNDQKLGSISRGEEARFKVAPGKYTLVAKIDWNSSKSIDFEIKEGEEIYFKLKGANPFFALFYTFISPDKYLILQQVSV